MKNLQTNSRKSCSRQFILSLQLLMISSLSMLITPAAGQTIQVNADGTQTIHMNDGSNPSIQINPDGTHTLIFDHGYTQLWVNPDGTHSVMMNANTQTPVLVNPEGTHTQIYRNGNIEIRTFPDGTSKTYFISEPFITEISTIRPSVKKQIKASMKIKQVIVF